MTLQEIVQLAVAEALRATGEPLNSIQDKESAEIKRVDETADDFVAPSLARQIHVCRVRKSH